MSVENLSSSLSNLTERSNETDESLSDGNSRMQIAFFRGKFIKSLIPAEFDLQLTYPKLCESPPQFEITHTFFHIHVASLSLALKNSQSKKWNNRLNQGRLLAFAKIATVDKLRAQNLGIQVSPLFDKGVGSQYYRNSEANYFLKRLHTHFASAVKGLEYSPIEPKQYNFFLIESFLFKEALIRSYPHPKLDLDVTNETELTTLVSKILKKAKGKRKILIDCSALLRGPQAKRMAQFEKFHKKLSKLFIRSAFPKGTAKIKNTVLRVQLIAFTKISHQHVLLVPKFLDSERLPPKIRDILTEKIETSHHRFIKELRALLIETGFRINPDRARKALSNVKDFTAVLDSEGVPLAHFAINDQLPSTNLPTFDDLFQSADWTKFCNLRNLKNAPPYLRIMPAATVSLIQGLADLGVERAFKRAGSIRLLQFSLFTIQQAIGKIITSHNHAITFHNEIERIHTQIQMILLCTQPYKKGDLESAVLHNLKEFGTIPEKFTAPKIHLKASAMHSVASVLSAVEKQKKTNQLTVVVQKDCYYETAGSVQLSLLEKARTYDLCYFDGHFLENNPLEKVFEHPPNNPIDLFVGEFHHNIANNKTIYRQENIAEQIKIMHAKKLLAKKCTVLIDTTIGIEKQDVKDLLADETVWDLVLAGKLNIVLVRSTQKFDMLGMDNYYGGITTSINDHKSFSRFNERMDHPNDQLKELSYQGITHLQKHASSHIDEYRTTTAANTQFLYQRLPKQMYLQEGEQNDNLLKIAQISDPNLVFLDLQFPRNSTMADFFEKKLSQFAKDNQMLLTMRGSFGFRNANFTRIGDQKRRLTMGLEDNKTLKLYTKFFKKIQRALKQAEIKYNKSNQKANGASQEALYQLAIKKIDKI